MNILSVQDVSFSYDKSTPAIYGVDLQIDPGEVVGLVGPNGSGKSTFIKLVFDLLELQKGQIQILGNNHRLTTARLASIYLPSDDDLPEFLTGDEYLRTLFRLYKRPFDKNSVLREFDRFGMRGRERNLIEDYSHGMRKKLQLISAFLLQLPLTVIDETINGIDLDAMYECRKSITELKSRGHSVLLCTHDFYFLQKVADKVIVFHQAKQIASFATPSHEHLEDRVAEILGVDLHDRGAL